MGYCYTQSGELCCDICGAAGANKYPCPFGYCPPAAACPQCRLDHAERFGMAYHREAGCESGHIQYQAMQAESKQLLDTCHYIRCSAKQVDDSVDVHVLFRGKNNDCVGFYMNRQTYKMLSLLGNFTPDDYRQFGPLTPAPNCFEYGQTTKEVILR